jgi:hypothetical protein
VNLEEIIKNLPYKEPPRSLEKRIMRQLGFSPKYWLLIYPLLLAAVVGIYFFTFSHLPLLRLYSGLIVSLLSAMKVLICISPFITISLFIVPLIFVFIVFILKRNLTPKLIALLILFMPGILSAGDIFKIGEDVYVPVSDTVTGNVGSIGGDVVIDGLVDGNIVDIGNDIDIKGKVLGDVTCIGGDISLNLGSLVSGNTISIGGIVDKNNGKILGTTHELGFKRVFSFLRPVLFPPHKGIIGFIFILFLGSLYLIIFRERVVEVGEIGLYGFVRTFGMGVLILFLTFIFLLGLSVTIIGIPLAILGLIGFLLIIVFGFTGISLQLGKFVLKKRASPWLYYLLGFVILLGIPFIGMKISDYTIFGCFLLWLGIIAIFYSLNAGLGNIFFTRFGRHSARMSDLTTQRSSLGPPQNRCI